MSRSLALLTFLAILGGCGPAGADFLGTHAANGTMGVTINGRTSTSPFADTISIREGTDSDLVVSWGSCFYSADVKGSTATVRAGTTCTEQQTIDGTPVTGTFAVGTGTLTRSGQVISLNFAGTTNLVYEGSTYPGTYTVSATLNQVAK